MGVHPAAGAGTTDRTVNVLRALIEADGPLSVSELGRRVILGPSTVHRFLQLLREQGLVVQDATTQRYGVGPELVRLSALVLSRDRIGEVARPQLQALVSETRQTALIAVRVDTADITFVERCDPPTPLRLRLALHRRVPVVRSVAGWAMLSHATDDDVMAAIGQDRHDHPGLEDVDPKGLLSALKRCRQRGWAVSRSQRYGALGVAAPIRTVHGAPTSALAVFAPLTAAQGISFERTLGAIVAREAGHLSELIGEQSYALGP